MRLRTMGWCTATLLALAGAGAGAVTVATAAAPPSKAEAGRQQPQRLERTIRVTMDYLLYLPRDYAGRAAWPLLLFLHGSGQRGDDIEQVKAHGPPKQIAEGRSFPFIVVSPQAKEGAEWQPTELNALLDHLVQAHKVDRDRIYVTGLSMGGYGAWALATYAPDRFAALVPICGAGDPDAMSRLARLPVWAFHGAQDTVVPLAAAQETVQALTQAGGNVRFTVYPDAGHDAWTRAYDDPALVAWLLAQKRAPRAGPKR